MASTARRLGTPNGAGYSATKFGVVGFTEALRIVFCISQPDHVNINEIPMRPTDQER